MDGVYAMNVRDLTLSGGLGFTAKHVWTLPMWEILRLSTQDVKPHLFSSKSSPISRFGALCVVQPTEIRSTPLAATGATVSGVMPPEASEMARPSIIDT